MTAAKEKTAPKAAAAAAAQTATAATSAFPNFGPNFGTLEVPAAFREMAEKNVMKAKEAYDSYKTLAEDATDALEDTFASINKGTNDFQAKAIGAAKAQFNAGFDFVEKMIGVKSLAEAIEIQSEYARKQFDALTEQAKDFQALASKVQTESTKPFKDGVAKAMNHWKGAF